MPLVARRWLFRLPPAGIAVACLAGCATSYQVEVNSIINPEIEANTATTYTLATQDPNLPDKDIHYAEISDRVRTALAAKGMFEAPSAADADIVVEVDYGERSPTTRVTTVQQTQILPPDPLGRELDPLTGRPYPPNTITIGGRPNYPGQNPYPGTRMQTATTTTERVTQVSEKYIRLTARENVKPRDRSKKKPVQIWIVEAVVEDERSDVYECMPAMVTGLTDYVGVSTGGRQVVRVTSDEP